MAQFKGKIALVTGGNSGLDKATVEAFARDRTKFVITARRKELGCEGGRRGQGRAQTEAESS